MLLRLLFPAAALVGAASAWNDIAGALTYKGTSHVFQGCPGGGQPGSQAHGVSLLRCNFVVDSLLVMV